MIGPVLYLPAIGLLIALFSMTTNRLWVDESSGLYLVGKFVSSMLWALMNHLGFLFCLGLASGLAKTRKAEAAFVAAMTWLMYLAANNSWLTLTHRLATGATNAQLYGSGQTFIFGFQVIDMGVFLGIILGCAVAFVHNRVVGIEFRGALSIYGNSKLVLIVMLPLVGVFAIATVYLWPVVELGISALTGFMKSFGAIGVFLYGFLNRFLIPTGLHHLIWSPFVFTSIGGQLLIDGQTVIGAKPIFLAEIARHPVDALSDSARFLTYGMVKIFGTAGMALAFYRTAKAENKQRLKVTLIPLIVTSVLVGITEPFEFLFIFTAPLLWLIYSLLDGFFQMLAWLLDVRVCATNGIIDFLVLNLPAGIGRTRWPLYVLVGLVEIVVMYLVFRFLIVKMNLKTPGREDGEEVTDLAANAAAVKQQIRSGAAEKTAASANDAQTAAHIVEGLGGAENILNTDNCMTRLRVQVKDAALVKDKEWFKPTGSAGLVVKGNNIQIIYGPKVGKMRAIVDSYLGRAE